MPLLSRQLLVTALILSGYSSTAFTSTPFGMVRPTAIGTTAKQTSPLTMTGTGEVTPGTFREAEVLGLKLMQEQKYEEALKGTFFYASRNEETASKES